MPGCAGGSGTAADSVEARPSNDAGTSVQHRSASKPGLAHRQRSVRRFIDDAAARQPERHHGDSHAGSDSEQDPLESTAQEDNVDSQPDEGHIPIQAQVIALDGSTRSSDSEGPLMKRRSGSLQSQQRGSDHDSDFASAPNSPVRASGPSANTMNSAPLRSVSDLHKPASKHASASKRHRSSSDKGQNKVKLPGPAVEGSMGTITKQQQQGASIVRQSLSTPDDDEACGSAHAETQGDKSITDCYSGANVAEPPGHDGRRVAEEAVPAFEMPSQMPRELQTWAWDKCVSSSP